jgi:hypothetical protein
MVRSSGVSEGAAKCYLCWTLGFLCFARSSLHLLLVLGEPAMDGLLEAKSRLGAQAGPKWRPDFTELAADYPAGTKTNPPGTHRPQAGASDCTASAKYRQSLCGACLVVGRGPFDPRISSRPRCGGVSTERECAGQVGKPVREHGRGCDEALTVPARPLVLAPWARQLPATTAPTRG